jgi:hypothetical protein
MSSTIICEKCQKVRENEIPLLFGEYLNDFGGSIEIISSIFDKMEEIIEMQDGKMEMDEGFYDFDKPCCFLPEDRVYIELKGGSDWLEKQGLTTYTEFVLTLAFYCYCMKISKKEIPLMPLRLNGAICPMTTQDYGLLAVLTFRYVRNLIKMEAQVSGFEEWNDVIAYAYPLVQNKGGKVFDLTQRMFEVHLADLDSLNPTEDFITYFPFTCSFVEPWMAIESDEELYFPYRDKLCDYSMDTFVTAVDYTYEQYFSLFLHSKFEELLPSMLPVSYVRSQCSELEWQEDNWENNSAVLFLKVQDHLQSLSHMALISFMYDRYKHIFKHVQKNVTEHYVIGYHNSTSEHLVHDMYFYVEMLLLTDHFELEDLKEELENSGMSSFDYSHLKGDYSSIFCKKHGGIPNYWVANTQESILNGLVKNVPIVRQTYSIVVGNHISSPCLIPQIYSKREKTTCNAEIHQVMLDSVLDTFYRLKNSQETISTTLSSYLAASLSSVLCSKIQVNCFNHPVSGEVWVKKLTMYILYLKSWILYSLLFDNVSHLYSIVPWDATVLSCLN